MMRIMAVVQFEPFPEPPGKKKLGHMAMAVLMIEALYRNLPPRKDPLWQESWDTLRGWVAGLEFFADATGGAFKKQYQKLKDAVLGDLADEVPELAVALSQEDSIEELEKKPDLFKKALKKALQSFAAEEKKAAEWVGFLDSLRVSLGLGSPFDAGWAALDTAYRSYFFDGASHEAVKKALSSILQDLG